MTTNSLLVLSPTIPYLSVKYKLLAIANLQSIRQIVTQLKPELVSKYHIRSLGLFGSIVGDDFTESSDIDILVDFSVRPANPVLETVSTEQ
jgi:predicted nucleotidyltransferase